MARKKSDAKAETKDGRAEVAAAMQEQPVLAADTQKQDIAAATSLGTKQWADGEFAGDPASGGPAVRLASDPNGAQAQGENELDAGEHLEAEGPAWLDMEAGREQAMLAAAMAANDLAGADDAIFGELADYLDKHADAPIDVLANVVLKARGEAYRTVTLAADGDLWWPLTAFKAVYVELMAVARREATLLAESRATPDAPDPLAELKARHDRIKRRERMARGTPYERRLRARRKAAAAALKKAMAETLAAADRKRRAPAKPE